MSDEGFADNLTGDDTQAEYPGGPEPLDIDAILLADVEPVASTSVPVEVTDEIFSIFRENFGENEAARLQEHWGDQALANQTISLALVEDHHSLGLASARSRENPLLTNRPVQAPGRVTSTTNRPITISSPCFSSWLWMRTPFA